MDWRNIQAAAPTGDATFPGDGNARPSFLKPTADDPLGQRPVTWVDDAVVRAIALSSHVVGLTRSLEDNADRIIGRTTLGTQPGIEAGVPMASANAPLSEQLLRAITDLEDAMTRLEAEVRRNCWAVPQ